MKVEEKEREKKRNKESKDETKEMTEEWANEQRMEDEREKKEGPERKKLNFFFKRNASPNRWAPGKGKKEKRSVKLTLYLVYSFVLFC